jgi:hypothetical protein
MDGSWGFRRKPSDYYYGSGTYLYKLDGNSFQESYSLNLFLLVSHCDVYLWRGSVQ